MATIPFLANSWRTTRWLLALLGACSIAYMPVQYVVSPNSGPRPGQERPVFFHSPDCEECRDAKPLVARLVKQQHWQSPELVDSRLTANDSLRARLDAAFLIPEKDQFHVPAVFYASGSVIGLEAIKTAAERGLSARRVSLGGGSSGFLWARWADFVLIGLSLVALAGMFGGASRQAEIGAIMLLSAVLLISGGSKLLDPAAFASQIKRMTLIPSRLAGLDWVVGLAELALAVRLLLPRTRGLALRGGIIMFGGFTAMVVLLILSGYSGSCGCFPWHDRVGWWTVTRDLSLMLASLALLVRNRPSQLRRRDVALPTADELI